MKKDYIATLKYKKLLIFIFCGFLVLSAIFLFLPQKTLAEGLEINYPTITDVKGNKLNIGADTDLPNYLRYVFTAGIFVGFFAVFLSLIWAGVLYLLSPAMPDALSNAKDRVSGAISGLLILATLYLIMTTINPALAIFKLNKLDPIPPAPDSPTPAGVYFYNSSDCSGDSSTKTSSMPDLGDLKNRVNSVSIVHHPSENLYYIAVLYDLINFSGKCQYIDPNKGCQSVTPFADSSSVYQYDFSPNWDGVYFYRKSYFDNNGGVLKIDNSQIKNAGIYIEKLENLSYGGQDNCTVPEAEQDCVNWDEKGNCAQKKCPNLSGENITSIKIKGNYFVLLIYRDETQDPLNSPWSFCQAFPTKDDVTRNGPNQIKWESVRNTGRLPNYIVIIPVKQK